MHPSGVQRCDTKLSPIELAYIRRLVGRMTGVVLGEEKAYLISGRLAIFAREKGISKISEVYDRLTTPGETRFAEEVVDSLLTKETSFFRNTGVFEALRSHVVPEIRARVGQRRLRIWCAACATGQEPYSVAMTLRDVGCFQAPGELDILATDISTSALDQAQRGEYSQLEIGRGLPVTHLVRYFRQQGHRWCIDAELRNKVRYLKLNLLEPGRNVGQFDIIFCRNVGIYFADQDKTWLMKRMLSSLAPSGYLFLGTSESACRYSEEVEHHRYNNVIYYQEKAV